MSRAAWTPEQDAELARVWASNLPFHQVVSSLGRSRGSIVGRVSKLHLPARSKVGAAIRSSRKERERRADIEFLRESRAKGVRLVVTKRGRDVPAYEPPSDEQRQPYRPGIDPKPEWLLQIGKAEQRRAA